MIVGNVLKFGYGDICCGHGFGIVKYQQFKPPAEIGSVVIPEEVEFIGDIISISVTYEDYKELVNLLNKVKDRELDTFEFKDYIFDFSNFDAKRVECVRTQLGAAIYWVF